ncbi:hypothetical protein BOW51_07165 [Solemya velesiana gill symbiont]|uniref:Methyltransferase type 11 domain-containing protein n=1 Tax=Solemya velesiana gill symbiont TaxID=1918948 RepID=A0A1T2KUA3_9GAMM|nr:hypothetical protein BOW51_07165 [Solemya velesiana gill symbiont]
MDDSEVIALQQQGIAVWLYGNTGSGISVADNVLFAFPWVVRHLIGEEAWPMERVIPFEASILDPVYRRLREDQPGRTSPSVPRLFLCMGGSDEGLATERVVDLLSGIEVDIEIICVIGAAYERPDDLRQKLNTLGAPFQLLTNPSRFAQVAAGCDLAITTMGQTLAELNCLGIASLVIAVSPFHMKVAEHYASRGGAKVLGLVDELEKSAVHATIEGLVKAPGHRDALKEGGVQSIDGKGGYRVAEMLFNSFQKGFTLHRCDVCGSDDFETLAVLNGRPIGKCRQCGLDYMHVRPAEDTLLDVYAADYFEAPRTVTGVSSYEADRPNVLRFANARLDGIEMQLPEKGRLLDVGCALGYYLEAAAKRGWEVSGIDISEYAVNFARDQVPEAQLQIGSVETVDFPTRHFDAIICSLVFEHFLNPRYCLQRMTSWLRPGGVLVLKVPHGGGVMYRFTPDRWFDSHPDNHFCDYTPETLSRFLESEGLCVVEHHTEGIYLERFCDALGLEKARADTLMAIEGLDARYSAFARNNDLGDSLVVYARSMY